MARTPAHRWLLLIHQIPPRPAYLRVKAGRQLARAGAVAIKNSVYALPATEACAESLAWVRKEIVAAGGDASVVEATLVDGLRDDELRKIFTEARDADYRAIAADARKVRDAAGAERLRRRLAEIEPLDFFGAPARQTATRAIDDAQARVAPRAGRPSAAPAAKLRREDFAGRTWVTREHVGVDRMASAWLIRRAIDSRARFRFVAKGAAPRRGEIRFDMFEGDFTHEGSLCTFEVLLHRFDLDEPALHDIAELIHDLDLKDGRYQRPDAPGLERVIAGIAAAHENDSARLERAFALFDDLRALSARKPKHGGSR